MDMQIKQVVPAQTAGYWVVVFATQISDKDFNEVMANQLNGEITVSLCSRES